MKYVVELNGSRHDVVLEGDSASVDGQPATAHLEDVAGTPLRLVTIGNEVHRVVVRRGEARGQYTLWVDGWRFSGDALDERTRTIREFTAASAGSIGPAPVIAPMPGLIVRVNVAIGDSVQPGQGVVIIEAMKMENELRVHSAGRVKAILVAPGTAVEKGALLVELETADS